MQRHIFRWIFLLLTAGLFIACEENDMAKVKAMFSEDDANVEVADSVQFIYKEGSYVRAIVTGKTVKRYFKTQNKLEFTDGLLVKFFEQLKLISVLKADYAENNDSEQLIRVSGNVYMENERHEILETDELTWNMKEKRVYTDKPVKVRTPENTIYGVGFDAREDFSYYSIRRVKGVVAVNDDKGFE